MVSPEEDAVIAADMVVNCPGLPGIRNTLKEGAFHDGVADVVQFVGTKLLI